MNIVNSLDERIEMMLSNSMQGLCELACFRHDEKRRFYKLYVGVDLFGDMMLIRQWGSLDSRQGNRKQTIINPNELTMIVQSVVRDRERKGYSVIEKSK